MSIDDEALMGAARTAAENAYCPYSGVRVGAALLGEDGRVFTGCNVENASYGLTLCAERAALVRAVVEGARDFTAVAIWASTDRPLAPCGACRQVIHEHSPGSRVLYQGAGGERVVTSLPELLPGAMGEDDVRE